MSTPTLERPTIGSLCSGYGGLDLAVEGFFGARTAWFSEFDPAPSKILAHHWPDVPNLGDMTRIDWGSVEPVDIIAGGTPCQDLSGAGKRKGMTEGTRSNLWVQMRECVAAVRPSIVIWENVRGAYSAHASSEVESEQGLLGESWGPDRPALRALGRVLGDLSDLGYDTEWVGVRASDAGAPHARFRVFVLAYSDRGRCGECDAQLGRLSVVDSNSGHAASDSDNSGCGEHGRSLSVQPEYTAIEHGGTSSADAERIRGERWGGHGDVVGPPRTGEADGAERQRNGDASNDRGTTDWGAYGLAIERWERVLDRFAPLPTERSAKGSQRLSPRFVEWMMGVPEGWVTGPEIGLTRNQQLKALGNGVVPQQAVLALSLLWRRVLDVLPSVVSPLGGTA